MLASKKKYDFLSDRYEQSASCVGLPEHQLADLNDALKRNGGPYECVPECHGVAMTLLSSGRESTWQTLGRPTFVDRWISGLLPALTHQIPIQEWQGMLDICSADHTYDMSHHQSQEEMR